MSSFSRTLAMSALLGATMLTSPLAVMAADSPAPAAARAAPAAVTAKAPRETIEQRISGLHASLHITTDEEADWTAVAKTMRDNAADMEKLVAEKTSKDPATLTAIDDLTIYGQFAQAHADGMKSLTASFATLYKSMPDAQKKIADQVFQDSGRKNHAAHG